MADDDATAQDDAIAAQIEAATKDRALAFDDPQALVESVKEWMQENLPDEVSACYWVTLSHKRDKGIAVEIAKVPANLRLKLVLGEETGGLGVFTRDFDATRFHAKWSIGAGVVTDYTDVTKLDPFVGFTVKLG